MKLNAKENDGKLRMWKSVLSFSETTHNLVSLLNFWGSCITSDCSLSSSRWRWVSISFPSFFSESFWMNRADASWTDALRTQYPCRATWPWGHTHTWIKCSLFSFQNPSSLSTYYKERILTQNMNKYTQLLSL